MAPIKRRSGVRSCLVGQRLPMYATVPVGILRDKPPWRFYFAGARATC